MSDDRERPPSEPAPPPIARALAQALAENGLDPELAPDVVALLRQPRELWPPCCGGLCDPCVLALQRTANRARALGWADGRP